MALIFAKVSLNETTLNEIEIEKIRRRAETLIHDAEAAGVVLNITQVPAGVFVMGNSVNRIGITPHHSVYRGKKVPT